MTSGTTKPAHKMVADSFVLAVEQVHECLR